MADKRFKLGLYEKALPSYLGWEERLSAARQSGYSFMEISIDETDERMDRLNWSADKKRELRIAIHKTGVPILTMCLSGNRKYTIGSEDQEKRQKGIQLIKDAVVFSVEQGIRIIQLASYDEYYFERNSNTEMLFYESLVDVTRFAGANGVTLAFENMDTNFINSIQKAMRFVNRVNSPWLQVYPDVGNLAATGLTIEEVKADFMAGLGHITAVHLKDAKLGEIRHVKYGEGIVDFTEIFRLLNATNFNGLMVAEMWSDEELKSIEYIKTARRFLNDKMNEAFIKEKCRQNRTLDSRCYYE